MALPSGGMFLFEKALSLSPEEWLRLRQWMFSTTSQDAALNSEDRTRSKLLHSIDVTSPHTENTSTRKDGEGSASVAVSGELLLENLSQVDAAGFEFLTSQKAEIPLGARSTAIESYQEDTVVDRTASDISISLTRSATTRKDGVVAPGCETRMGGAENGGEASSVVPRRVAAARAVRRKRMRKQLSVLPLVKEKCEGQPPDVDFRPKPKIPKTSAAARPHEFNGFCKALPTNLQVRAAATREAVTAADCWSEIVEEEAGLLRVSVRKGNACITKRFSPADSSDRLPELMLQLNKLCPPRNLARSTAPVDGSTSVPAISLDAGAVAAAAPERSQDTPRHIDSVSRTPYTTCVGREIPNTPSFPVVSPSCENTASAQDHGTKRSKRYIPIAKHGSFENKITTGAAGRAQASAQLYCDWVCKHFDQVHHYLSTSKSYLEPDGRSRERAASLALELMLRLPQDAEQQRYLQWITSLLNASTLNASLVPDYTDEELVTLQQTTPVANAPHTAAGSAAEPFTSTLSSSHHTPQSYSHTTGPARHVSNARASPCSTSTLSPTKASSTSEATHSDAAVATPHAFSSSVSPLPKRASRAAAMAAQLLEGLCLLDPTPENNKDCADFAQPGSHHASVAAPFDAAGSGQSKRKLVDTKADETTPGTPRRLPQYGEKISPFQFSGDHAAAAVTAVAAAAHELRDANRQAATTVEAINVTATTNLGTATASRSGLHTTASSGTSATTRAVTSAAVDGELARAGWGPASSAATAVSLASPAAISETARVESIAEEGKTAFETEPGAAAEATVGTAVQRRADAAAESPTSAETGLANCSSAAYAGGCISESEASREIVGAVPSVSTPTALIASAGGTASISFCGFLEESKAAQMDVQSRVSKSEDDVIEQRCSKQPTQLDCNDVRNGEGLPDEMMEAARALVGTLSREKEAMAWVEQNNFSSILQMLQTALEEPAAETQQQPEEQHEQPLLLGEQQEDRQQPNQHVQQQQQQQKASRHMQLEPQLLDQHPQTQPTGRHVETVEQQCEGQQQQQQLVQQSVDSENSARQPQACGEWEQRGQALEEELEQWAELGGNNSICTLLYSLLQKRLPPASEAASLYHEDALLQETGLSYNNTACSSQNSRKVSSCAEESLVQVSNSFTSHAHEAFSTSGESSSQATTQTACGPYESAAATGGAFPCFLEEGISLPAADFSSFSSRITSSTSACASSSLGDVCWPPCDSSNHLKQERSTLEVSAMSSKRVLDLPAEDRVHRTGRPPAIFSSHATAAAAVG